MLEKEKKKYLDSNWYLVGSTSEFSKKNDFKTIEIFGEPLLLYYNGSEIKTFVNVCPHRGSKIKNKNKGNEILRCEYHGWCFDANGNFLSSPFLKLSNKNKFNLKKWKTFVYNNLIFIAKNEVKISLKKYLIECNSELNLFSKNVGQLIHSETYNWDCNWKVAIENSIDEYHAPFLHKSTFRNVLTLLPEYYGNKKTLLMKMPVDKGYFNSMQKFNNFFIKTNNKSYTHILFFPFTTFASTMGVFNFLQTYLPVDEKKTRVTTNIFLNLKKKSNLNNKIIQALLELAIKFNQTVFNEDRTIVENIFYKKNYNKKNIFTLYEERVKRFRKLTTF